MSLTVILDVYSGRPNPSWALSEGQSYELLDRVYSLQDQTPLKAEGVVSKLGYRGFSVVSSPSFPYAPFGKVRLIMNEGIIDPGVGMMSFFDRNRDLEGWLLSTAGDRISGSVYKHVRSQLEYSAENLIQDRSAALLFRQPALVCTARAVDAPAYDPVAWSSRKMRLCNNCYNYANDKKTNTYAHPGRAHGLTDIDFSCSEIQFKAQADGLAPVSGFGAQLNSGQGWYVGLAIWLEDDDCDYHWYRQDANGCWSHKLGMHPITNLDNSGKGITDPRTCNRWPYTVFCTYMVTTSSVVIR